MFDSHLLFVDSSQIARLRDGFYCRIRASAKDDRHLFAECFERLSPDSRRMRFFAAKPALSDSDLDFLASAEGYNHIAVAAIRLSVLGEETEALGFARCIRLGEAAQTAELSIAVADEVQRLGVGSALLDRLQTLAASAGIRRLLCEALAENRGMRALARQMRGNIRWHGGGTVQYEWPLPEPMEADGFFPVTAPHRELSESLEFWLRLTRQSIEIGFEFYDALSRYCSDPRSLNC